VVGLCQLCPLFPVAADVDAKIGRLFLLDLFFQKKTMLTTEDAIWEFFPKTLFTLLFVVEV
jgi:hypothetical protein